MTSDINTTFLEWRKTVFQQWIRIENVCTTDAINSDNPQGRRLSRIFEGGGAEILVKWAVKPSWEKFEILAWNPAFWLDSRGAPTAPPPEPTALIPDSQRMPFTVMCGFFGKMTHAENAREWNFYNSRAFGGEKSVNKRLQWHYRTLKRTYENHRKIRSLLNMMTLLH